MMRAPKWLMFLPQVLMRTSTNGGQIAKRFNALVSKFWGKLITLGLKDSVRLYNMQDRGPVARNEEDESKYLKKTVVDFIYKAEVSKSVSRLNSTG